jgi:hypothetical protein
MFDGLMLGRLHISVVMSLTALILVNLLPLAGVLWLGWRMFDVLLLFWFENVVIGAVNLLRMGVRLFVARELSAVFRMPFFALHYFGFCAGHGLALLVLFGLPGPGLGPSPAFAADSVGGFIRELLHEPALVWGLAAVTVSHMLSFVVNFLWGGEWRHTNLDALMEAPYARVIALHIFIVLGAAIVASLGQPLYALALLVVVKTALDASAHLKERRKLGEAVQAGA